jgi:hypothetical protein
LARRHDNVLIEPRLDDARGPGVGGANRQQRIANHPSARWRGEHHCQCACGKNTFSDHLSNPYHCDSNSIRKGSMPRAIQFFGYVSNTCVLLGWPISGGDV